MSSVSILGLGWKPARIGLRIHLPRVNMHHLEVKTRDWSARANRQRLFCPKCRAPFREGPPDVFELYPEYESDDEGVSTSRDNSFSNQDREDVEQLAMRADGINVNSEAVELEGVVARGEQLLERFRDDGEGNENDAVLASMEEHLLRLRQRLDYHRALENLREQVEDLTAERDTYRDQLDAQHAKYIEAKDTWRALVRKYKERKEHGLLQTQAIQQRDDQIRELQASLRTAQEKAMRQNMAIKRTNEERGDAVARVEENLRKAERDKVKLEKKYMAAKADLQELQRKHSKCKQARPPSSEVDDSLEILPPSKPAPLRTAASSSSLRHSLLEPISNTSLRKSGSASNLSHSIPLTKSRRPFYRVASIPSTSRDAENALPGDDGEWEDSMRILSPPRFEAPPHRSKPSASPKPADSFVFKAQPKSKPAPFPFSAPRSGDTRGKGKERAIPIPSSDGDIQEIGVNIPSPPAAKRRKVSNDPRMC
ncbi:hypothetical protein FRB90_010986 [Tulasnella sp. 427]|nr:hypothetical protein FRB90_010986 [Tulasnella sp. 427]